MCNFIHATPRVPNKSYEVVMRYHHIVPRHYHIVPRHHLTTHFVMSANKYIKCKAQNRHNCVAEYQLCLQLNFYGGEVNTHRQGLKIVQVRVWKKKKNKNLGFSHGHHYCRSQDGFGRTSHCLISGCVAASSAAREWNAPYSQ